MRQKIEMAGLVVALLVVAIAPGLLAAQGVSLEDQLKAQYKLVKMGSDTSGYAVIDAGTLLAIQKGGILGVPYSDPSILSTKYEAGTVHTPSSVLSKGIGFGMRKFGKEQSTHLFQAGEKVYPSSIAVNLAKDSVAIGVVACDSCNQTNPPTYNKAVVVFQFPKGSLAKANAGEVEDTIGQLLAISDDAQQDQGQQGDQGQGQQGNNQGGGPPQQQGPPPEPAQIAKGQTPDQVKDALGTPDKIVNLGAKQIYVYKDLKVTFVNGKVTDVQ